MSMTIAEFKAQQVEAATRKGKRAEKAALPGHKPKAKRRGRKSERAILAKKLDSLVSMFVRLRDKKANNGLCFLCRIRPIEVAYHIIPRGRMILRWDLENVRGGCSPCNFGEKNHRLLYREKHIGAIGALKYAELEARARETAKFSVGDLRDLKAGIERRLREGF